MADSKKATPSFDAIIKAGREKKKHERLAQEILGNKRRSSTPGAVKKGGLGASLASRVGVIKRPTSLSRSQSSRDRTLQDRPNLPAQSQPRPAPARVQNQTNGQNIANGSRKPNAGLSIKGAASGPFVVIASNFAPGTTAADIESVMASVGGEITYCKLVASSPTVIAEMGFRERSGADTVIGTFNNKKKADGRLLYVHMKDGSVPDARPTPPEQPADDAMEVDENTRSREAENKLREERRGGRGAPQDRPDILPSGPRRGFMGEDEYYYHNGGAGHPDNRYGFGGSGGYAHRGGGGWYDNRSYGHGGPQWRR